MAGGIQKNTMRTVRVAHRRAIPHVQSALQWTSAEPRGNATRGTAGSLLRLRVDLIHVHREPRKQHRLRLLSPAELAGFGIFTLGGRQRQHGDRFVARVDDPAFGNACPRVFGTLRLQVARRIVGVDDFDDEISRFRDCSPAWSSCSASTTTRSGSRKRPSRVLTRYSGSSTKPSFAREMWAKNKR